MATTLRSLCNVQATVQQYHRTGSIGNIAVIVCYQQRRQSPTADFFEHELPYYPAIRVIQRAKRFIEQQGAWLRK
jgi:hypothetical protein